MAEDSDQLAQKKVLKYLDDMGLDPAGFGFAAFYENDVKNAETKTEDMPEENAEWTDEQIKEYIHYDPVKEVQAEMDEDGGFFDAVSYQHDLAEETAKNDLIFKYIISNERTYLVDEFDKDWADKFTKWIGTDLTGMIKTGIAGIDDSTITVDRDNQTMVISSKNGLLEKDTAYYDLSSYAGRYGMPLEFLLSLHLATMSPDLTDEMITNKDLRTAVQITMEKDTYAADYEIKYKGKELPFKLGKDKDYSNLFKYGEKYITDNGDGTYQLNLSENDIKDIKNKISIVSLKYWIDYFTGFNLQLWNADKQCYELTHMAKDAVLGNETFRVSYHFANTNFPHLGADWSVYLGPASEGDASIPDYILELLAMDQNSENIEIKSDGSGSKISYYDAEYYDKDAADPNYGILNGYIPILDTYSDNSQFNYEQYFAEMKETVKNNAERVDWKAGATQNSYDGTNPTYETGIIHGIEYYTENEEHLAELKKPEQYYGMIAILSQLDAYLYQNGLNDSDIVADPNYAALGIQYKDNNWAYYNTMFGNENLYAMNVGELYNNRETPQVQLLLAYEWISFLYQTDNLTNCTNQEIINKLNRISSKIGAYFYVVDTQDNHFTEEQMNQIMSQLFSKLGYQDLDGLTAADIQTIYSTKLSTTEDFEYVFPRIKNVLRHWYKDVIFYDPVSGIDVYDKGSKSIPIKLNTDNQDLEITAILSGGTNYTQSGQPYVVKGDVVTLDGEVVEDSGLEGNEYTIRTLDKDETYTLGDGYRTTKKLFTQGYYYTFDGSQETAKSIWYAKKLEELSGAFSTTTKQTYAKVHVKNGRITIANTFNKENIAHFDDISQSPYADFCDAYDTENKKWKVTENVITGDGWSTYKAKTLKEGTTDEAELYYVVVDGARSLKYLSVGDSLNSAEDCKKSAERINEMLESMGVVTIRKPISFDSTSKDGDVMSLTAFSILEGMHTETAEYIYRDLKEMLIELGYYTKAEFEAIDTNVLKWFIPDYKPVENTVDGVKLWRQNKGSDALKFGAIIYPKGYEVEDDVSSSIKNTENNTETNSSEEDAIEGFEPDLDVIAPGNCKIIEVQGNKITIEFDGLSEPEIGILDGYTMIINGIKLNEEAVTVVDGDGNESEQTISDIVNSNGTYIVKAGATIGYTADKPIQVIMKNNLGGYIDDIDDYMSPEISTSSSSTTYPNGATAFSLTETVLSKDEFVAACSDYMSRNGKTNSDFSEENLKKAYEICRNKHINPEWMFVTAIWESGLNSHADHNYWGLDAYNNGGGTESSYPSVSVAISAYCDRLIEYQDPTSSYYAAIMANYEARSQETENGGCNPNGYGTPDTIQGIQSLYSSLGNHSANGSSSGGKYYLDPDIAGVTDIYATHQEYVEKCLNVHDQNSNATTWEEAQYNAYQVRIRVETAKSIFGEKAGTYMQ